ncbi:universal stress protein [Terracoccus sp. 273MFTsu3.1]|uniref:universal stress protein n=1 Tax=Terracoccus sp. 273MFTsu3.1 TaxID=1172188 RepID=UPI000380C849|nr:universal stress protein [Terracoccus sp. 273MFTsu3.1]
MVKGTRTQHADPACGQIVVGYEGPRASQCALVWAAAVSRALDDSLKIVHAVELDLVPSRRGYALRPLSPSLETVVETLVGGPSTWSGPALARGRVHAVHAVGGPAAALVDASMSAELVVLGTRGRGRTRSAIIGSVSNAVVAHAYCPVVVLHTFGRFSPGASGDARVPGPRGEVVCAVGGGDGDGHAARTERIVSAAVRIAVACGAALRLVTVARGGASDAAGQRIPYAVGALTSQHPELVVTADILAGEPVTALAQATAGSGLLVVGAPDRGGVGAVLAGHLPYQLIHDATCPVMLVP